jgi:hypothetical protein
MTPRRVVHKYEGGCLNLCSGNIDGEATENWSKVTCKKCPAQKGKRK